MNYAEIKSDPIYFYIYYYDTNSRTVTHSLRYELSHYNIYEPEKNNIVTANHVDKRSFLFYKYRVSPEFNNLAALCNYIKESDNNLPVQTIAEQKSERKQILDFVEKLGARLFVVKIDEPFPQLVQLQVPLEVYIPSKITIQDKKITFTKASVTCPPKTTGTVKPPSKTTPNTIDIVHKGAQNELTTYEMKDPGTFEEFKRRVRLAFKERIDAEIAHEWPFCEEKNPGKTIDQDKKKKEATEPEESEQDALNPFSEFKDSTSTETKQADTWLFDPLKTPPKQEATKDVHQVYELFFGNSKPKSQEEKQATFELNSQVRQTKKKRSRSDETTRKHEVKGANEFIFENKTYWLSSSNYIGGSYTIKLDKTVSITKDEQQFLEGGTTLSENKIQTILKNCENLKADGTPDCSDFQKGIADMHSCLFHAVNPKMKFEFVIQFSSAVNDFRMNDINRKQNANKRDIFIKIIGNGNEFAYKLTEYSSGYFLTAMEKAFQIKAEEFLKGCSEYIRTHLKTFHRIFQTNDMLVNNCEENQICLNQMSDEIVHLFDSDCIINDNDYKESDLRRTDYYNAIMDKLKTLQTQHAIVYIYEKKDPDEKRYFLISGKDFGKWHSSDKSIPDAAELISGIRQEGIREAFVEKPDGNPSQETLSKAQLEYIKYLDKYMTFLDEQDNKFVKDETYYKPTPNDLKIPNYEQQNDDEKKDFENTEYARKDRRLKQLQRVQTPNEDVKQKIERLKKEIQVYKEANRAKPAAAPQRQEEQAAPAVSRQTSIKELRPAPRETSTAKQRKTSIQTSIQTSRSAQRRTRKQRKTRTQSVQPEVEPQTKEPSLFEKGLQWVKKQIGSAKEPKPEILVDIDDLRKASRTEPGGELEVESDSSQKNLNQRKTLRKSSSKEILLGPPGRSSSGLSM